jgi:hypothetical protein
MERTLKVHLMTPTPELVHEFRNFGEDVYRALRQDCEISLQEIDASTSEFHLRRIPTRHIHAFAAKIREIAAPYKNLSIEARDTIENQQT